MSRKIFKWFTISLNIVLVAWLFVSMVSIYSSGSNSDNAFLMFVNNISVDSVYTSLLSVPLFPVCAIGNVLFTDVDLVILKWLCVVLDINLYLVLFNVVLKVFLFVPMYISKLISRGCQDE